MRRSEIRTEAANTKLLASSPSYSPERARRLTEELRPEYKPAAPYVPPAYELGAPPAWLYLSKRLELVLIPNEPLWCSPAISLGATTYYRLTPGVLHWLECAGRVLQVRFEKELISRAEAESFVSGMRDVYAFAARHLDPAACEQAKVRAPALPGASGPEVGAE